MARRRIMHRRPTEDASGSEPTATSELSETEPAHSGEPLLDVPPDVDEIGEDDDFEDADLDAEIALLYADDSEALARWKDRLSSYVDLQGTLDALRLRPSSEQPWPSFDNPMLGYLKERGAEIAANDGIDAAIAWLAANSWFEGAIAERSRFIRLLDAD